MDETTSLVQLEFILEQSVMVSLRVWSLATILSVALGLMAGGPALRSQAADVQPQNADHGPALINTCLITSNVKRLVDFYEPVLNFRDRQRLRKTEV
jgi:hypothetical protein